MYQKQGNFPRALEDYDNAVRLCPDYKANLIDRNFIRGNEKQGVFLVTEIIELLSSKITSPRESAADYYYTGVRALFKSDSIAARRSFNKSLKEGYKDLSKVKQHLENLEKRR